MKLLYVCGKERSYVRNEMILAGLRNCGCDIIDCSDESGTYVWRFVKSVLKVLAARKMDFDFVFIGCLGHYFVPLAKKATAKPIIFDPFVSMYDTMCLDRKKFRPDSPAGRILYRLDKAACDRADRIILDTYAHINYFTKAFDQPPDKFHRVLVGADESLFYPRETPRDDDKFKVFYYSSFLPLHGTEYIVEAAGKLQNATDIEFVVIGNGLEKKRIMNLAKAKGVSNIHFIDWIPYGRLPGEIAKSDVCLGGHFSDIKKARRVIAGKTFQFLAMKKPVIVGDCEANRELLVDGESAFFVPMADAEALADAILKLKSDGALRDRLAEKGHDIFTKRCSNSEISKELAKLLHSL
ncbi:glycosyltransferase [Geobacter sp. AOG2]|uniref:glycosyltransferase n=1 Tax=Geobacter sp. AOG2 TaxID=1566347 RepID=UPI001CC65E40|nr:glycosyltransferase [Geobacter sp. AOG2]GFE62143.1 hypothetical protein AOG2_27310 [Geobacter sp. AOG2]